MTLEHIGEIIGNIFVTVIFVFVFVLPIIGALLSRSDITTGSNASLKPGDHTNPR